MKPKDKLMMRFELSNLQARFALLAEHSKKTMIVLTGLRDAFKTICEERDALKKENLRLALQCASVVHPRNEISTLMNSKDKLPTISSEEWNSTKEPGQCDWVGPVTGVSYVRPFGHDGLHESNS